MKAPRFLICGLGSIGRRHLRNLRALGQHDIIAYRARGGALPEEEAAGLKCFRHLDDALAAGPQAVVVSNPTSLHLPVALAAARQGCHLFIEKPLSHSLEGVAELEAVVGHQGLVCLVGCNYRFHPGLRLVKRLLKEGAVGRVVSARLEAGEYLPDWHPWEDYRQGYSARRDLGGGVILTLIHWLDAAWWLFGEPRRLVCLGGRLSSLETDTEDTVEIVMEYRGGPVVSIHLDYVERSCSRAAKVVGEQGTLVWSYFAGLTRLFRAADGRWHEFPDPPGLDHNATYLNEMKHFLACLEGRETPEVDLAAGRRVLALALAARRSLETGAVIDLEAGHG